MRYQWYWAGNQDETKKLTPDLKHTVKRHVVAKRIIPIDKFPIWRVKAARKREIAEQNAQLNEKKWMMSQVPYETAARARIAARRARDAEHEMKFIDKKQSRSLEDLFVFEFNIQVCSITILLAEIEQRADVSRRSE